MSINETSILFDTETGLAPAQKCVLSIRCTIFKETDES